MASADALRQAKGDLRLEQVTKEFTEFTAVDNLSLQVPRGSFFALLGPSGCGKTTTLRMIAGLEQPTSGRVLIGDTDLTGSRPYERPVNTVFQSYALFPHLSVRDNVAFGPKRRGVKNALAQADSTLELVQLTHLAKRKPQQLSGGQQQRVAVARALVNHPEVLLLDEPLGALDLKLRREMQVELKRIQTEVGLTFIHVTHDQEEAMTMADTVAVMNAGRIEQMGAPEALYDLPRTAFVATFLGQSNLTEGTATQEGDWVTFSYGEERFPVPHTRSALNYGKVFLGVRPEKCRVHESDPGPSTTQRSVMGPATVLDISFIGVATNYLVRSPAGNTWAIYEQNMDVDPQNLRPGDDVWISWAPQHAFIVSADGPLATVAEEAAS
ncbi:ABC transporter ATP-binding protein [Yimella sp. cx-573]|nr:ABC transporter ATP-binding protein [Yimella sp. cx-573]